VAGEVEKAGMEAVSTATVAVPLDDDRAHIVVQHLARHAAKREERVLVRLDQRFDPLVGDELDIGGPAPAQRRHEHREPVCAAPDDRPVHLHLFARLGLEADDGRGRLLGPQRAGEHLQHRVAARIAALAQFHQQHARGDPLRGRSAQPFDHIGLERIELRRPRRARLIPARLFVAQIAPHRVPRDAGVARDLANALAVPMQYPDLQRPLRSHHPVPPSPFRGEPTYPAGQTSPGDRVRITSAVT
jgi:hypothetical protein